MKLSEPTIRTAYIDLERFSQAEIDAIEDLGEDAHRGEQCPNLEAFFSFSPSAGVVAIDTTSEKFLGYILYQVSRRHVRRHVLIRDIAVEADRRREGIGNLLLDFPLRLLTPKSYAAAVIPEIQKHEEIHGEQAVIEDVGYCLQAAKFFYARGFWPAHSTVEKLGKTHRAYTIECREPQSRLDYLMEF